VISEAEARPDGVVEKLTHCGESLTINPYTRQRA
jgi:hypothetical protein